MIALRGLLTVAMPGSISPPASAQTARRPVGLIWLAGVAIALTALLPADLRVPGALTLVIVLGVPHGALDGEIACGLLRPRFGAAWFPVFAAPYLLLFSLVLIAWRLEPLPTLAAFLAASVWHFGSEETDEIEHAARSHTGPSDADDHPGSDTPSQPPGGRSRGDRLLAILFHGGLPIAVPMLLKPAATMAVFATIAEVPLARAPLWLGIAAWVWVGLTPLWLFQTLRRGSAKRLVVPAVLVAGFIALPPITGFAIYFVCVHAPAHTHALIRSRRAPRVYDAATAAWRAVPITVLTVGIGVALWPLYPGTISVRLLAMTLQMLAALTLPHLLFETWLDHNPPQPDQGMLSVMA
jgi:Brp/Blh family beta-carotene 15,15'-monooxygenase